MKRNPVVAGQFYPGTEPELKRLIESFLIIDAQKRDALGCYVPHAGYIYSGKVAGSVYSRINIPGTVIVIGPNHTGRGESFSIMTKGSWQTPLGAVEIDEELAKSILAGSMYLSEDAAAHAEDHSVEVQVPFLQYLREDVKLVPITVASAADSIYKDIGLSIAKAIKTRGENVLIVASGDMSHYEPSDKAYKNDMLAVDAMRKLSVDDLLARVLKHNISMCGYATASIMIHAVNELGANNAELIDYGNSGNITGDMSSVVGYAGLIFDTKIHSPQVMLAKQAVEEYIRNKKKKKLDNISSELEGKAGVFVSIHKGESLRGCIGTIGPTKSNIGEEIIQNAISSATQDPRFSAVTEDELDELDYKVDVLMPAEPVESIDELDAKRYGVIVESGWHRGLLLPDLDGVDTPEQQIQICRMKAGLDENIPVKLYRFEVKRFI